LIKKNPDIAQQQLAKALKVSLSTVKREMKLLQDRGEVLREGAKKAGKWIVMDLTAMDEAMDKQDTYQIDSVEPILRDCIEDECKAIQETCDVDGFIRAQTAAL
jgi:DNA-binding Lrp family transcriptional regulator